MENLKTDQPWLKWLNRPDFFVDIIEHLPKLYEYGRTSPGKTVLELGVNLGGSTTALALACAETGKTLYSVDIGSCDEANQRVRDMGFADNFRFWQGDDRNFDGLLTGLGLNPPVAMIFIDTSHERAHTETEIELYHKIVMPGGFMIFHDGTSFYEGVTVPVLNFLVANPDWKLTEFVPNNNGLIVLQKKETE